MPLTRHNRFERPGRSFHPTPTRGESSKTEDLELGAYPPKRPEQSSQDEDELTVSDQEAIDLSSGQFLRFPTGRSREKDSMWGRTSGGRHRDLMKCFSRKRHRRHQSRTMDRLMFLLKATLMTLGLLQCVTFVYGVLLAIFPDDLDLVAGPFEDNPMSQTNRDTWFNDLTADVQPLRCHSHNDYWRHEPLLSAIRVGCTSVEADIWHFGGELYVAHKVPGIRQSRTLRALYLDPLKEMLDHQNKGPDFLGAWGHISNGIFDTKPDQSLVLLIDFKNDPNETWDLLHSLLSPFREGDYLTYYNGTAIVDGPLTIVVSGAAPFSRVISNSTHRDVFYDAPLGLMSSLPLSSPMEGSTSIVDDVSHELALSTDNPAIYSPANSYYASVSFVRSIGYPWHSSLTQSQLDLLRKQIRGAHSLGLKVRYWGVPPWPVGLRNYLWRVLVREGVDYLSVDEISAVTKGDWGPRKGGWGKKWWR